MKTCAWRALAVVYLLCLEYEEGVTPPSEVRGTCVSGNRDKSIAMHIR